jgi:hypothetical protein
MGNEDEHVANLRISVARLEEKVLAQEGRVSALYTQLTAKAGREWTIIMTGIGLAGTIIAKSLGFM